MAFSMLYDYDAIWQLMILVVIQNAPVKKNQSVKSFMFL